MFLFAQEREHEREHERQMEVEGVDAPVEDGVANGEQVRHFGLLCLGFVCLSRVRVYFDR